MRGAHKIKKFEPQFKRVIKGYSTSRNFKEKVGWAGANWVQFSMSHNNNKLYERIIMPYRQQHDTLGERHRPIGERK